MTPALDATLVKKVSDGGMSIDDIAEFISTLMVQAVNRVNEKFSPRQLAKRDRKVEPLPIDRRQLSSYRTRLGTMLEYALSTYMDSEIEASFHSSLRLTFAVAHEYPDFFVRDGALVPQIRIEMKAVDRDSDEQAARFEVLSGLIQGDKDVVILVGWEWKTASLESGSSCEYPNIFAFVVVPAADLANERDQSIVLRGGQVSETGIVVRSKKMPGELTKDQGNAGKILRIVHQKRKADPFTLSLHIQRYLQFVAEFKRKKA